MTYEPSDKKINPPHYKEGDIEFIDYLKSNMSQEKFDGYLEGQHKKIYA